MAQYRNVGPETVVDYVTGKVVEPDAVVEIPEEIRDHYENHPVLQEVGAYVAPIALPAPAPVEVDADQEVAQ